MPRILLLVCVMALACRMQVHAQTDTVRVSMAEAEGRFLKSNLQLLAARFNVDAAKAAVTQAGLWNNPNLSLEQNVYNQFTKRWFDMGTEGNSGVQIQQLLLIAGKRGKLVRLAEINTDVAEQTFADVMRALRLALRSGLYDLYFLRQSLAFYERNIATITNTVGLMENVEQRRAVLLAELLRVKSLLFSLQNERLGIVARISDVERNLRVLLNDTSNIAHPYLPVLDLRGVEMLRPDSLREDEVIASALEKRPDLRKASAGIAFEEANLSYQKSLSWPDLTVGGLWSRAGSYIPNYTAVTLSFDIPIFNRNQGNIEVSEHTLEANRVAYLNYRAGVVEEVRAALRRAVETDRLFRSFDRKFPVEYSTLVDGTIVNYQQRNMSVLEFTDFIESYRTSMLQMNQLENDRADALEMLNYAVGTTILDLK